MRKIIFSLISVMAAMAVLNAQQVSPNQTAATQQRTTKAAQTRVLPQPGIQPTQAITGNNNTGRNRRIVSDNPANRNQPVSNRGHVKPADSNPGNKIVTNGGRGQTAKDNHDNYAEARRRYHHE